MVCVLCQYELSPDPGVMAQYSAWMAGEGVKQVLALPGLQEFHAYREYSAVNPRITAMLFFEDLRSALQVASSEVWLTMVSNLTRWGSVGAQISVLEPSPLLPQPLRPA